MNLQNRIVFHHVARAGGIEAARPSLAGLEASGLRRHLRTLEDELGQQLFHRQPFCLTPAGRILYEHDRPHLEALLGASDHLRRKTQPRLRAGVTGSATKLFLLPAVHAWLSDPGRDAIECRFGTFRELRPALEIGELDLLVTALDGPAPAGFDSRVLGTFAQVLIVPDHSPLRSAETLWTQPRSRPTLITPDPNDPVSLAFERGLRLGGLEWPARLACDSPAAIVQLIVGGLGYGLSLAAEGLPVLRKAGRQKPSPVPSPAGPPPRFHPRQRGIRELPLVGFDPVPIVALWRPEDTRRLQEPLCLLKRP